MLKSWKVQHLHGLNEPVHLDMHSPAIPLHYWRMGGEQSDPNPALNGLQITS